MEILAIRPVNDNNTNFLDSYGSFKGPKNALNTQRQQYMNTGAEGYNGKLGQMNRRKDSKGLMECHRESQGYYI